MLRTQRTATAPAVRPASAPLPSSLLEAKFRAPLVPPDAVLRRRLVSVLREGVRGPLTLVSAPAGYGKSLLVAAWAERAQGTSTIVHMSMDDGDVSPLGFWTSLLDGLVRNGVDVEGVGRSSSVLGDRPMLVRLAQRISAHESPLVWVLDCGKWALPPILGDGIHRLIDSCDGRLRVVLLTRTDPPLPLHRYRLDGAITEIRADDLAFTAAEVSMLMQRAGLDLSPGDLAALQTRTGGWPAGLRFAAMSLAGRVDTKQAIEDFRGDRGNVAAYLMSEVLAKQPPAMREFLLRTCVVDQLDPGLVAALTGQHCDHRALQFMSGGNSFIEPVPGNHGCYRYQALFREFLFSQLSFEKPDLVSSLHRLAAEWYAQSGESLAAVRHAVAAQAWSMATRYFVEGLCYGNLLVGGQRTPLRGLFAHLPTDEEGVDAAVTRAALALTELDTGRCVSELDLARSLLDRDQSVRTQARTLAIAVLAAVAASHGTDLDAGLDAALTAQGALRLASAEDVAAHPELRVIVAACEGRVLLQRGDFTAALTSLGEAVRSAEAAHLDGALAKLHGLVALVEAMTGNLNRAIEIATQWGAQSADSGSNMASTCQAATLALAWVRIDQYDLDAAQELLDQAGGAGSSYDAKMLGTILALLKARLLRARGELELARATLRAARPDSSAAPAPGWLDRALLVDGASSLLLQGKHEDVITMLRTSGACDHIEGELLLHRTLLASGREAPDLARPSNASTEAAPLEVQVTSWLVRAEQSMKERDAADGELCVQRALRLAAPQHLRRPFFEAPEEVRGLLERSSLGARSRWLQTSGSIPGGGPADGGVGGPNGHRSHEGPGGVAALANPLTAKEQEVLGFLAELLTTDEIAETMFVSVNTVRSHVRSILRKLGVTRRNEAVRRAWELRLLPRRGAV